MKLFDEPLSGHPSHASVLVGDFFEHLTAKVLKGDRLVADEGLAENPDVQMAKGQMVESKACGWSRWLLPENQFEMMESLSDSLFAIWGYRRERVGKGGRSALHLFYPTVHKLYAYLAQSIDIAVIMPTSMIRSLINLGVVPIYTGAKYWNQCRGTRGFFHLKRPVCAALQNGWRPYFKQIKLEEAWYKRTKRFSGTVLGFQMDVKVHRFRPNPNFIPF